MPNKYRNLVENIDISTIWIILFLIACNNHGYNRHVYTEDRVVVDLDKPKREAVKASSLFKNVKTIILEENSQSLVGIAHTLRVFDEHLYVLDNSIAKSLLVFDLNGKYIRKIGGIGRGPGEYIGINDYTIDHNNKLLYVLDNLGRKINKYKTSDGSFVGSIRVDIFRANIHRIQYYENALFAIFAALLTHSHQSMEWIQVSGFPLGQRLIFSCYSLVTYAGRFVLPVNLMYLYPFPISSVEDLPITYLIYPVVVATTLCLLCVYIRKIPRPVIFGILFYLINISLMLHIIPMSRFMITADRYVYFASTGLFFISAWYAIPWLQMITTGGKKWILAIVACYLLYLGGYTHIRSYAWKNSATLKKNFFEKNRKESEENNQGNTTEKKDGKIVDHFYTGL